MLKSYVEQSETHASASVNKSAASKSSTQSATSISSKSSKSSTDTDSITLSEIQKKIETEIPVFHEGGATNNSANSSILVKYEKEFSKFSFYDNHETYLGSFSVMQIVRHLAHKWDSSFYSEVELSHITQDLISKMIGDVLIDPVTQKVLIKLKSHLDSPFMGDIEMLVELNNAFYTYETNRMSIDLFKITDEKARHKIKITIKQFIYLLVNHTLKIISHASEIIKNDSTKKQLKEQLMKYSVGLTYRMSKFISEQLDDYTTQHKSASENLERLYLIKSKNLDKLEILTAQLEKQNDYILKLVRKIETAQAISSTSTTSAKSPASSIDDPVGNIITTSGLVESSDEIHTTPIVVPIKKGAGKKEDNKENNKKDKKKTKKNKKLFEAIKKLKTNGLSSDNFFNSNENDEEDEDSNIQISYLSDVPDISDISNKSAIYNF